MEEEKIKELIKKTAFACSSDSARPLFTGVLCDIKDNKITFVGTNTHRLAIRTLDVENAPDMSVIIPSLVLKEINKNLNGKLPQDVIFSIVNNQTGLLYPALLKENSLIIRGSFRRSFR